MDNYETVTDALNGLKLKGYSIDFNIAFDKLICKENNICLNISEFEIMQTFRFEGNTDPGDEMIVYAIAAKDGLLKGVFTSAYGMYAESVSTEMIKKLAVHQ